MADSVIDLLGLYADQTEDVIRARWDAWANEGITLAQPDEWTDTREGSMFQVLTQPGVRESARIYDLMGTEVPAAANPLWAWESYLDDHAEVQDLERKAATPASGEVRFTGPAGTPIVTGFVVGTEPATPDAEPSEYETTASGVIPVGLELTLPIRATEAGSAGNVAAGAVKRFATPIEGVTVVNDDPITGGTDTEGDASLRGRLLERYVGRGSGNVFFYRKEALQWPGVGRVSVIPLWDGPGTVKLVVTDPTGAPLPAELVAGLQLHLDPVPGQGEGVAPIGATVTVETATALPVAIVAPIEFEQGYTLDGFGGTVALAGPLIESLRIYVEGTESGGEIVRAQVIRALASVRGVHDVGNVLINGNAVNLPVPADPPQIPTLSPPTLTDVTL